MTRECEAAGFTIHLEDGNVVGTLIAAKEEIASGIEVETARIVPSRPFFLYNASSPFCPMEKIPMLSCSRLPA